MNRREFCQNLALLAAGAAALPEQIKAFTQLYDVNSRHLAKADDVISIEDIYLGGTGGVSAPTVFNLLDREELVLSLSLNTFGGVVRWARSPNVAKFATASGLRWDVQSNYGSAIDGFVIYTDSTLKQTTVPIKYLSSEYATPEMMTARLHVAQKSFERAKR